MNKKNTFRILKFMILVFASLFVINFVYAGGTCECDAAGVFSNDCTGYATPACDEYNGENTGECYCIDPCVVGDGICASYYIRDSSGYLYSCDESTATDPYSCCTITSTDPVCQTLYCGNNYINPNGEQCDLTKPTTKPSCWSATGYTKYSGTVGCYPKGHANQCRFDINTCYTYCGNNVVESAGYEDCDYGWSVNGVDPCADDPSSYGRVYECSYCGSSCTLVKPPYCGDGNIDTPYETCDDGAANAYTCTPTGYGESGKCTYCDAGLCTEKTVTQDCGDGVPNGPEGCDKGNQNGVPCNPSYGSCPWCSSACVQQTATDQWCGDGTIQSPNRHSQYEECDSSNFAGAVCTHFANAAGDYFTGGNLVCDYNCKVDTSQCYICGNGVIDGSEQCDDGDSDNNDACKNDCTYNVCPDGQIYTGVEQCDDGNFAYDDFCTFGCKNAKCSDGYLNTQAGGEVCDGTLFGGKTCSTYGYDTGSLTCNSCTVSTGSCSCSSGRGYCGSSCVSLSTVDHCNSCTGCSNHNCGVYNDVAAKCNGAYPSASCAVCSTTSCTDDTPCKASVGAYCNDTISVPTGVCTNTCEFNATVNPVGCKLEELGGCKPGDKILITINYRGACSGTTAVQVDMAERYPYPATYTGADFCNVQQLPSLTSMSGGTFSTPGLEDTQTNKQKPFEYIIPADLGNGFCKNHRLRYFDVGLKGLDKYYNGSMNVTLINPICGDDNCVASIGENLVSCFRDCFKAGWSTLNNSGWSLVDKNVLRATTPYISLFSNYSVDLKADTNYTLQYNIFANTGCVVYFDFDGGKCTSATDLTRKSCFTNPTTLVGDPLTGYGKATIKIGTNGYATNGKYFKGVRLSISTGAGCTEVRIANISFTELAHYENNISYNYSAMYAAMPPGKMRLTGCCPNTYCWDGNVCQNSSQWMDNASLPGIWNNLDISTWTNRHIDTANQSLAVTYRCVILDNNTNEAQWIPSKIKYDWNYMTSGFCARETDCFVNDSFLTTPTRQGYSKGCVHHGDVVSDAPYSFGNGNHYCYLGNWTTKSYIVATFLQNISEDKPYRLQCYDDASVTYNLNGRTLDDPDKYNITSSCVLIQKESALKENVITGIVFEDALSAKTFLTYLKGEYLLMYDIPAVTIKPCINEGTKEPGSNFTICIEKPGTTTTGGLFVYYETNYNYMIFSDSAIGGLTQQTIWNKIGGFFKGLFTSPIITTPFTAINYTTNYDKIYVLRNTTTNVTALEEAKYNEIEKGMTTIFYVKYDGTVNDTNPLYREVINKTVNDNMTAQGKTDISVQVSVSNKTSPNEQEIIIRSQDSSGLWRYFTSILRTR